MGNLLSCIFFLFFFTFILVSKYTSAIQEYTQEQFCRTSFLVHVHEFIQLQYLHVAIGMWVRCFESARVADLWTNDTRRWNSMKMWCLGLYGMNEWMNEWGKWKMVLFDINLPQESAWRNQNLEVFDLKPIWLKLKKIVFFSATYRRSSIWEIVFQLVSPPKRDLFFPVQPKERLGEYIWKKLEPWLKLSPRGCP